jgi:hypothetical protein
MGMLATVLSLGTEPARAQRIGYFGKNRIEFALVDPVSLPAANGTGIIEYKGSKEPGSRWRASLKFSGLEVGAPYVVVIQGRFGSGGSPEASAFTPLCTFTADGNGEGGCFWYFRGLARLNLVQLRSGDENGPVVLEASRGGAHGNIATAPNRFSPGGEVNNRRR